MDANALRKIIQMLVKKTEVPAEKILKTITNPELDQTLEQLGHNVLNDPHHLENLETLEKAKGGHGEIFHDPVGNKSLEELRQAKDIETIMKKQTIEDLAKKKSTGEVNAIAGLGLGGASQIGNTDMSPLPMLQQGYNKYAEVRDKLQDKLADQLNISGQDKNVTKAFTGVVADPLNVVEGGAGVGLGAIQSLMEHLRQSEPKEEPKKQPELNDILSQYKMPEDYKKTLGMFKK